MTRRTTTTRRKRELTPVDDVRRVRRLLHKRANGDIRKMIDEGVRITAELREKLGLISVPPPETKKSGK